MAKKIKKKKKSTKKWSWKDYAFNMKDKGLIEKSALTPVLKDGSRKFKGATTKKGEAHGPVNAGGIASAASVAPVATGPGYGNSAYGFAAYGEALDILEKKLGGFVGGINDPSGDIANALLEGYNELFGDESNSKVILLGFQPSFRDCMQFDMDELIENINGFRGKLLNVFVGPKSGFEDIDTIMDWYAELGISEDAMNRMSFLEKSSSVCGYDPFESTGDMYNDNFDYGVDYIKVNSLSDMKNALSEWGECGITGCSELYMLGEIIYVLKKLDLDYEIDPVGAFTL